ncbi:hypothetical protein H4Q26_000514 [Puccinia striiformis f. sp. tritici PST-130]|nr:hypothetical protein H4Q26_000514 [Puccinia striiformis f. sp. tritici PST-130]
MVKSNLTKSLRRGRGGPAPPRRDSYHVKTQFLVESQESKRLGCHLIDDASQSSNLIDHRSNSNSAKPLEFLLDHQSSRINNDSYTSDQLLSSLNKTIRSKLINRITLPLKGKVISIVYSTLFSSSSLAVIGICLL